jgi:hypothetical protein
LALLRFTGEQFAVTLPQLARLMGRSEHAGRWLRSRWERAGWARGGRCWSLTQKRRRRAELIMREHLARYGEVVYFAAPAPLRMLTEMAEELGGGRVQVRPLPGGERA